MSGQAVRVLVVDDNFVMRSGLVSLLQAFDVDVVGEAGDGRTAIEMAERLRPDLVFLDVQMPLLNGVEAVGALSEIARVIMLTHTDDPDVVRASLANGASGYLVYGAFTPDELAAAVASVTDGRNPLSPGAISALVGAVRADASPEPPSPAPEPEPEPEPPPAPAPTTVPDDIGRYGLSAREVDVMRLIIRGRSNSEIAQELFLAEKTVKNHVNRIYAKLGVSSRATAIALWMGTADRTSW